MSANPSNISNDEQLDDDNAEFLSPVFNHHANPPQPQKAPQKTPQKAPPQKTPQKMPLKAPQCSGAKSPAKTAKPVDTGSTFFCDVQQGTHDHVDDHDDSLQLDAKRYSHRNVVVQACNVDELTEDDFPDKKMDFKKTDKEVSDIIEKINSLILFAGYEDEELKTVISYMYKRKVTKGEVVIRQGEDGDAFYVIRSGKYECTALRNNENVSICMYDGSGYFGDLALIHHAPRAATITAKTNGELWVLNAMRYVWLKKKQAVRNAECFEHVIRQIPMFSKNLTNSQVSRLIDAIEVVTMHTGDLICRQGDPGDAMYFILDGKVSVSVNGTEVCTKGINDFFGERALVLDEGRAATCSAKTSIKLAKLSKESFELLIPDSVVESMREYAKAYNKKK